MQMKCDNPNCRKLFDKRPSQVKLARRHFCSLNCKAEVINRTVVDPQGEFTVGQEVRFVRKLREFPEDDTGLVNGFSRDGMHVYVIRTCNDRAVPYPREWLREFPAERLVTA
jgi:hypothetical protein